MVSPFGNEKSFYDGVGLPFQSSNSEISNIVSILFSRPMEEVSEGLLSSHNIENIFYDTSPEYLQTFQKELQKVLIHAFNARDGVPDELFTLFIHQALSLFPFAYPEEGFELKIPIKRDGEWILEIYKLDKKFELGNQFLMSPMPAYGFKGEGPPMLVFMGTTYPAGKGFLGTLISDFTPGASVGALPFFCGQKELGEWLQIHPGAYVMGISLGGALSLHAAKNYSQYISKVFAFVPPGLYPCDLNSFDNSTTEINLVFQDGDFVSTLGFFPEGQNIRLYCVYEKERDNGFSAHARVFLSSPNIKVYCNSLQKENQRIARKLLTGLHMVFSPLIFLLILPLYLLSPLFQLLKNAISRLSSAIFSGCCLPTHSTVVRMQKH